MTNRQLTRNSDAGKILVFSGSFLSQPLLLEELRADFPQNTVMLTEPVKTEEEVLGLINLHQAHAVIVGHEPVGAMTLAQARSLRVVVKYGVGLDNLDLDAFSKSNVSLLYPQGINKIAVAELVLGLMLNHFRLLNIMIQELRAGHWQRRESRSLSALRLGIVGFGHIGQCLASVVRAFDMKVIYYDIADRQEEAKLLAAEAVDYETLLRDSDCMSFHVPLTEKTRSMFGEAELKKVKANALIINSSRGGVVDHQALVRAVHANKIDGYAADVFAQEPLPSDPLHHHKHIYLTPHVGAFSLEARLAMGRFCIQALRNFFDSARQDV